MNKKTIIAVIILCFLVLLVIILKNNTKNYILLDGLNLYEYKNNNYIKIDEEKAIGKKMNVYTENKFLGSFTLTKRNSDFLQYKGYTIGSKYIAVTSKKKYDVIFKDAKEFDSSDMIYVRRVLKEHGINENTPLSKKEKISFDIDNDGENEKVINISNFSADNENLEFNFIFIVDGDITYLVDKKNTKGSITYSYYDLRNIIYFSNKEYAIILVRNAHDENVVEFYSNINGNYVLNN